MSWKRLATYNYVSTSLLTWNWKAAVNKQKLTSLWKSSWTLTLLKSGLDGATICFVAALIFGAVKISEKSSSSSRVENFDIDL